MYRIYIRNKGLFLSSIDRTDYKFSVHADDALIFDDAKSACYVCDTLKYKHNGAVIERFISATSEWLVVFQDLQILHMEGVIKDLTLL